MLVDVDTIDIDSFQLEHWNIRFLKYRILTKEKVKAILDLIHIRKLDEYHSFEIQAPKVLHLWSNDYCWLSFISAKNCIFIRSISVQNILQSSFILIRLSYVSWYLNEINAPVRHPWRVILSTATFSSWYSVTHLISIMKSPAAQGMWKSVFSFSKKSL